MSQRQLLKDIEDGLPSKVYYLYAKEQFLLKDAIDRIAETIPENERDFSLMVYDLDSAGGKPASLSEVTGALETPSFFGSRKIVILRNVQTLKKKEVASLHSYLERPSQGSVFVMLSQKAPDKGLKEKLKGSKVYALDMRGNEIKSWMTKLARAKGVSISSDALDLLISVSGSAPGLLSAEIEKVSLTGKKQVGIKEVSELLHGSAQYNIFSLADALIMKKKADVFKIYRALGNTLEPYAILGAVNWKYSDRAKRDNGERVEYFRKAFEYLSEADRMVKTTGGVYPLEDLFMKLLQI